MARAAAGAASDWPEKKTWHERHRTAKWTGKTGDACIAFFAAVPRRPETISPILVDIIALKMGAFEPRSHAAANLKSNRGLLVLSETAANLKTHLGAADLKLGERK